MPPSVSGLNAKVETLMKCFCPTLGGLQDEGGVQGRRMEDRLVVGVGDSASLAKRLWIRPPSPPLMSAVNLWTS